MVLDRDVHRRNGRSWHGPAKGAFRLAEVVVEVEAVTIDYEVYVLTVALKQYPGPVSASCLSLSSLKASHSETSDRKQFFSSGETE